MERNKIIVVLIMTSTGLETSDILQPISRLGEKSRYYSCNFAQYFVWHLFSIFITLISRDIKKSKVNDFSGKLDELRIKHRATRVRSKEYLYGTRYMNEFSGTDIYHSHWHSLCKCQCLQSPNNRWECIKQL